MAKIRAEDKFLFSDVKYCTADGEIEREIALRAMQPDYTGSQAENYSFPRFVCVRDLFMCRWKTGSWVPRFIDCGKRHQQCRALGWWYHACHHHQLDNSGPESDGTIVFYFGKSILNESSFVFVCTFYYMHLSICVGPVVVADWRFNSVHSVQHYKVGLFERFHFLPVVHVGCFLTLANLKLLSPARRRVRREAFHPS